MARRVNTSSDLLFGLLALQTGLIQQSSLVGAFLFWSQNKDRSMADILVEQGGLDDLKRALIEGLVGEHLKMHGGDLEKSLAAIGAGNSTREKLAGLGDPDLNETLAGVGTLPLTSPGEPGTETLSFVAGSSAFGTERYRIVRNHAKGGLGEVFVAIDRELNREVALKEIQLRHAQDQESRDRFILEAEVTGGLEHPGIVPVYGMGTYADGRPYYAMRFIKGDSLKEAIAAFHAVEPLKREPGQRSLELRKLLRRFLDVCNAIEYAHQRGVLHRDLKPGNIMVGRYGETLVVDWGLARAKGKTGPGSGSGSGSTTEERTFVPTSGNSSETIQGSAMGTPAYMSPEQAAGDLDRLGPCSDVYSLGATLYSLLTGKPPFQNADLGAILQAVQKGQFLRPRTLDHTIDPPLEAICLKAMALRPEDRYNSPRALADDIEHWAADEPVTAWREPVSRRARRWVKRHRTAVTSGVATLVMALVGTGVVLAVQTRANAQLKEANSALADSNARERERFILAMDAIKLFHGEVSEDLLMKEKAFEGLRTKLLRGAADFYRRLETVLEGQPDRASRVALGTAYFELALLTNKIGNKAEAFEVFRKAMTIRQELVLAHPEIAVFQSDLASGYNNTGIMLKAIGNYDEALEAYERARVIRKKIAAENPNVTEYTNDLASSHNNIGVLLWEAGKNDQSLDPYLQALDIRKRLASENPNSNEYQHNLSGTYNNLGILFKDTRKIEEARVAHEKALRIRKTLADENPKFAEYQNDLASSHNNIGILLSETGQNAEAYEAFEQSLLIRKKLVADYPNVTEYQSDLASSYNNIGSLLKDIGKHDEALDAFQQALKIWQKRVNDNPNVTEYQNFLAMSYLNIGVLLEVSGKHDVARESALRAQELWQKLTNERPDVAEYQQSLAECYLLSSILLKDSGKYHEAGKSAELARDIWQRLADENPDDSHFQYNLATSYCNIGNSLAKTGKPAEAMAEYRKSIEILERHPTQDHQVSYQHTCTYALIGDLAAIPGSGVSLNEGQAAHSEAMRRLHQAVEAGYHDIAQLRTDRDLDSLRGRADFQLLMLDLAFPAEPFAP